MTQKQLITKDLKISSPERILEVVKDQKSIKPVIDSLQGLASELVKNQDVSNQKGRDKIRSDAFSFSKLKTSLDSLLDGTITDLKKKIDSVNSMRREVKDTCDLLRDTVRKPLSEYEESEKLFKEKVENTREYIKKLGLNNDNGVMYSIYELNESKEILDGLEFPTEDFRDTTDEMRNLVIQSKESLDKHIETEQKRLDDEAELVRLREAEESRKAEEAKRIAEEKAKREAEEREAKLAEEAKQKAEKEAADKIRAAEEAQQLAKQEAAEKVRKAEEEAERKIQEARIKVEREKEEARQKEIEAEQAEAARLAEEERKAKNTKFIGGIRKEAKEDLMQVAGIDEDTAKKIVLAIKNNQIRNVSITH